MYCESCGTFVPDGQAFCANCGSPVAQAAPAAQPAPTPAAAASVAAPATAPAPAPQPMAQPAYQQPAYQQPQPQYQQPQYQQPVYQTPQYQAPTYQQPVAVAQPVYAQPLYAQPVLVAQQPAPAKRGNGMATAGLVFGILTLVFCWIPSLYYGFGLLGLIFSIVGLVKKNASGKGKAIAGLILAVLGVIAGIIIQETFWAMVGREIDNGINDFYEELETYSTGYKPNANPDEYYIDGDFVTTDKGYVSGVLHIDNFIVEY